MYVYENHQGVERRSASQVALRREEADKNDDLGESGLWEDYGYCS